MLVSYSVENFRSIKDKVTIDLKKRISVKDGQINTFSSNVDRVGDLLKTIVIYGYNSSGKSNFLRSAFTMRNFILASHKLTHGEKLPFEPFLLNYGQSKPTKFEIEFIHKEVRYFYTFSTNIERIIDEQLVAYPNGSKQIWFDRKYNELKEYEWSFSPRFKGERDSIKNRTLENVLFFSKAANENHELIKPLTDYFRDYFYVSANSEVEAQTYEILETRNGKTKVLNLLNELGLGIDGLTINSREINDEDIPSFLPEEIKEEIRKNKPVEYEIKSVHKIPGTDKEVLFDFETHESSGTRKIFKLAGIIIKTLDQGSTLFIDELEKNLHCKLVSFLVELFNNSRWNKKNAQLIFSTHSPTVLDTNTFRRDQIWFTDKNSDKSTILYNLIDVPKIQKKIKPTRKGHSISKGVLEGRYFRPPLMDGKQFNLFGDDDFN